MSFFKQLSELMNEEVDLNLKISKSNDHLIIRVHPKSNKAEAKTEIPPLNIRGTITELESDFFPTITEPIKNANGVISNLNWHDNAIAVIQKQKAEELKKGNGKKKTTPKPNISAPTTSIQNQKPLQLNQPKVEEKKIEPKVDATEKFNGTLF